MTKTIGDKKDKPKEEKLRKKRKATQIGKKQKEIKKTR